MRKFMKSISVAFIAQIVSLLVSVFMSFFVSKFMSVEMYGYYQLFLFCTTYVGIFQLGISEGNYLENGGKSLSTINKGDLKNQFLSISILQIAILGVLFVVLNIMEPDTNKLTAYTFAILYSIAHLWVMYFGLTLQAINETEKYSIAIIAGKLITLILFVIAVIVKRDEFVTYSLIYLIGYIISGLIVMFYGKDIILNRTKFSFNLLEHKKTIIAGSSLLFASLISSFIIGINRIYIELFLGIEEFGRVSMSLSLSNFLVLFAIQFGMVMFPSIISLSDQKQREIYTALNALTPYLVPIIMLAYIPLAFILQRWLPNYTDSIHWILLFIPYIVYEIKNQIILYTYIKIHREEKYMLKVNIITFVACGIINLLIMLTLKNIVLVFIVLNVVLIIKSILLEMKVNQILEMKRQRISIIEACICMAATLVMYYAPSQIYIVFVIILYAAFFCVQRRENQFVNISALRKI